MRGLPALAKLLVSDQLKVRKKAQLDVGRLLCKDDFQESGVPTYMEMLAICKGLHYNLWMQDKLLLKEEVVRRTCEILPLIPNSTVRLYYVNGIFETLAREWDRLDNWRVDKFMLVCPDFDHMCPSYPAIQLTRDFFTQGLHSFSPVSPQLWDSFLEAVFEKVLNDDIQHAVGLKLHMCNIVGEELSKKKVKTFCIVSTLKCLVSRLVSLPRHHSYAHALLRLIHVLLSTLRKRSEVCEYFLARFTFLKPSIDDLINIVTNLENSSTAHKKSLRKIKMILVSIRTKKVKIISSAQQKHQITGGEHSIENVDTNQPAVTKAYTTQTLREFWVPGNLKYASCHRNRVLQVTSPVHSEAPSLSFSSVPSLSPDSNESNDHGNVELHASSLSSSVQTETVNLLVAPPSGKLETPLSRRVSFGKVFRKKFKSSQRLSMTPTVRTTPKKGILRGIVLFVTHFIYPQLKSRTT
ncbi:hypothetical protein P879_06729 [Paragonimus westermani]|uniref:Uncharacterized protein n=1 Tax=Paragonimus westermani TaxID=34504 RepID=A0A8T0CYI1_9TREM|nr:hypothetical protein P879_06729 [Paragonimus westermani]